MASAKMVRQAEFFVPVMAGNSNPFYCPCLIVLCTSHSFRSDFDGVTTLFCRAIDTSLPTLRAGAARYAMSQPVVTIEAILFFSI